LQRKDKEKAQEWLVMFRQIGFLITAIIVTNGLTASWTLGIAPSPVTSRRFSAMSVAAPCATVLPAFSGTSIKRLFAGFAPRWMRQKD